jgi:hypothetical protein
MLRKFLTGIVEKSPYSAGIVIAETKNWGETTKS